VQQRTNQLPAVGLPMSDNRERILEGAVRRPAYRARPAELSRSTTNSGRSIGMAARVIGDRHAAKDVTQEVSCRFGNIRNRSIRAARRCAP